MIGDKTLSAGRKKKMKFSFNSIIQIRSLTKQVEMVAENIMEKYLVSLGGRLNPFFFTVVFSLCRWKRYPLCNLSDSCQS